jgi:endonuclease YncB( thermonuclease family)
VVSVVDVVDGDTIKVRRGTGTLRLIGRDGPETKNPPTHRVLRAGGVRAGA